MSLRALDLNLLTLFDAIYKARSLTRAAENAAMSQPAMSRALARMRHQFKDPLFLRDGRSISPTPRADELALSIDRILRDVGDTLAARPAFDPAKSTREFNLMLTDYGEMVLLPPLMEKLEALNSTARIHVIAQNHAEARELLHFGKVDFYLWASPIPDKGFRSQLVIEEELWCLVRSNGKERRRRLTLDQYLRLPHIVLDWPGWQGPRPIEKYLQDRGLKRDEYLSVPTFFDMPLVVTRTALVSTMPSRMAQGFAATHALQCFKAPLDGLEVPIHLLWHSRQDSDPAHRWMRELLVDLCANV
ncbi:LysR family transcriptional regulator [Variovorax rhizosphaerae]|uniref:LysR family transcriptional regulator n=1 Tax=Variovorax rhizosphaerae TaxID=1836200 RepID=A0ABU8WE95_9BURK